MTPLFPDGVVLPEFEEPEELEDEPEFEPELFPELELLPEFESIYPKAPLRYGGDDRSFDSAGVPTLWFNTHEKFMDFHTPLDTLGTVDPEKIVQCVKEACRLTEIISKS